MSDKRAEPGPDSRPVTLTREEEMAVMVVRTLGREALDRLLLCGRYRWVAEAVSSLGCRH